MDCFSLRRTHHLYYQLGCGLFFLAFLAPNAPFGMLWLRCMVIAGSVLLIIWGWQVECTLDAVVWASLFLIINAIYVGALLCKLRPVKFEKEIEAVSRMSYILLNTCDFYKREICNRTRASFHKLAFRDPPAAKLKFGKQFTRILLWGGASAHCTLAQGFFCSNMTHLILSE